MDMQQFLVTDIGCCASDPLEPGVRAQAIETQQKTLSQGYFRQGNPRGRRFESIHQSRVQSSLFQHVQQSGHRRSEEHTSELQSLMRTSYAVFCLKTKKQ